jgi:hypothetical protein
LQVFDPNIDDDGTDGDGIDGGGNDGDGTDGDFGLRLMYSIDGCKWKIFGARPKLPQVIISNATNEVSITPEVKQVSLL